MLNDYILVPGLPPELINYEEEPQEELYLKIKHALSELSNPEHQTRALASLNVPDIKRVEDLETQVSSLENAAREHHSKVWLHDKLLEDLKDDLNNFITEEVFNSGIEEFITKTSVGEKLDNYYTKSETKKEIEKELEILDSYVEKGTVYPKEKTYCKNVIDKKFITLTELEIPQIIKSYNYATLGNVKGIQKLVDNTFEDIRTYLKSELGKYVRTTEVWTRSNTYNKELISNIIEKLVDEACKDLVKNHVNNEPHLDLQDVKDQIKKYANNNLTSKAELEEAIIGVLNECERHRPVWKTSGPVLTTVGYVEDNTDFKGAEFTLQLIFDKIFYGSKISLSVDETVGPSEMVDVTMCLHSGLPVKSITLYMNGEAIDWFDEEAFAEGCITKSYGPITEDTEFTFTVVYDDLDNTTLSESAVVKVQYPIFVGIIPKMKAESTITLKYLKILVKDDGVNNEWLDKLPIVHRYKFKDPNFLKLIVGIPTSMNKELDYMSNYIQTFTSEAFNFHRIDITYVFADKEVHAEPYDFYIYSQPLSSLNSEVTFNFVDKK